MRRHILPLASAWHLVFALVVAFANADDAQAQDNPPDLSKTQPVIRAEDMQLHIQYLASDIMEGRLTGTDGERMATEYAARVFESLGLEPAGEDGSWFQSFAFTAGVSLGDGNRL